LELRLAHSRADGEILAGLEVQRDIRNVRDALADAPFTV